jgi:hypothetical protein
VPVGAVAPRSLFGIPSLLPVCPSPWVSLPCDLSEWVGVREMQEGLSFILVNVAAFRKETTSPDLPEAVLLMHYFAKILAQ